jgi:prepilin-type processing-associated H-X9-DG protein
LRSSASKYIFVEEMDGRGGNMGAWALYHNQVQYIDPIAIWHGESSTLAFADGHAEPHKWHGEQTIQMAEDQTFWYIPTTDQGIAELKYLQRGYAHRGNR